jgi:hypothetical protein
MSSLDQEWIEIVSCALGYIHLDCSFFALHVSWKKGSVCGSNSTVLTFLSRFRKFYEINMSSLGVCPYYSIQKLIVSIFPPVWVALLGGERVHRFWIPSQIQKPSLLLHISNILYCICLSKYLTYSNINNRQIQRKEKQICCGCPSKKHKFYGRKMEARFLFV